MRALIRRLCTAALAGVFFCACVAIIAEAVGWSPDLLSSMVPADSRVSISRWSVEERVAAAGWAAILGVVAVGLALAALPQFGSVQRWYVLPGQSTKLGGTVHLYLADRAARALVAHAVSSVDGVQRCHASLGQQRDGWKVRLQVRVHPLTSMPSARVSIASAVEDALMRQTGIATKSMRLRMVFDASLRERE